MLFIFPAKGRFKDESAEIVYFQLLIKQDRIGT